MTTSLPRVFILHLHLAKPPHLKQARSPLNLRLPLTRPPHRSLRLALGYRLLPKRLMHPRLSLKLLCLACGELDFLLPGGVDFGLVVFEAGDVLVKGFGFVEGQ